MTHATTNSSLAFIDLSINKSIDFIASTIRQLLQLIICLVFIVVVGKIISFFSSKTAPAEAQIHDKEILKQEINVETEPEALNEQTECAPSNPSGWDSESIQDPSVPYLEIQSSNVTAKTMRKQLKRKCISVGPIMLTPNSELQIVRTVNAEEREERYRYDILPMESTNREETTAVNVCVPCNF